MSDSGIGDPPSPLSPKRDTTRGGKASTTSESLHRFVQLDRLDSTCRRGIERLKSRGGGWSEAKVNRALGERNPVDNHNTRGLFASGGCTEKPCLPHPSLAFPPIAVRRQGKYAPGNTSISGNIMARFTNNYTGDVGPLFARYKAFLPCFFHGVYAHPFRYPFAFDIYYPCISIKPLLPVSFDI